MCTKVGQLGNEHVWMKSLCKEISQYWKRLIQLHLAYQLFRAHCLGFCSVSTEIKHSLIGCSGAQFPTNDTPLLDYKEDFILCFHIRFYLVFYEHSFFHARMCWYCHLPTLLRCSYQFSWILRGSPGILSTVLCYQCPAACPGTGDTGY